MYCITSHITLIPNPKEAARTTKLKDAESRPDVFFNSDHCLLTANIEVTLSATDTKLKDQVVRYRKPEKKELER